MTDTDMSRRGRRSKRKGADGENEVRDLIREHGWEGAHRNFMSGAAGGGDLADALPDWHIEAKRVEMLELHKAWRQADEGKRPTDSILVVHRGNNQPWLATVLLTDLIGLDPFGWSPLVVTPRQSLRAEFLARLRNHAHPLAVSTVAEETCATVLLTDLLSLLAIARAV